MLIDWFTVFAQIVNFLILVYLLKRFLYAPIVSAMDRREANIASIREEADRKRAEADEKISEYRKKSEDFEAERGERAAKVREEMEAYRLELLDKIRAEINAIKSRWEESVQQEKEAFYKELQRRAGKQIFSIAADALTDLAGADLEKRMMEVFIGRLENMDDENIEALSRSLDESGKVMTVCSAFEIPEEIRSRIMEILRNKFGEGVTVRFEHSPELLCGIDLKTGGYVIGWNLEDYLKSLAQSLNDAFETGAVSGGGPGGGPPDTKDK